MHCFRKVTDNLYWVGANDRRITLFENIHPVPHGVSYNSYLLLGEKTVLFDAVDWSACRGFLDNIAYLLNGRSLDYLVVNHVEPDHGASIDELLLRYPDVKLIGTDKAFLFMRQFGFHIDSHELISAKNDAELEVGDHKLKFITASMVHWPEVMFTFDMTNGALFTADAFGSFKTLDGRLFNDEVNYPYEYLSEARRYYFNIVGKYGVQVQPLLKKMLALGDSLKFICPLHGLVWRNSFDYIIGMYDKWSRYEPEDKAVVIIYASMYGNTESAANALSSMLCDRGVTDVRVYDVSNTDISTLVSECARVSHIVFASCTYNFAIYPPLHALLNDMKGVGFHDRTFAVMENGTWAIKAGDLIEKYVTEEFKNTTLLEGRVTVKSSVNEEKLSEIEKLADIITASVKG